MAELKNLKKGDTVILRMFTGVAVAVKEVIAADAKTVTLETAKGKAKFSKKTGVQVEPAAKSERFANYITEDDGSFEKEQKEKAKKMAKKKAEKTKTKKAEEPEVEDEDLEDEEEELEEELEEEPTPKKAKKAPAKPAKKAKKPEPEDDDEDFDEDEYEEV